MKKRISQLPVVNGVVRTFSSFIHAPQRFDELSRQIRELNEKQQETQTEIWGSISQMEERIRSINQPDITYASAIMDQIRGNGPELEKLNLALSGQRTLWGNPEKLHISPTAAVFTCFFNTNSGEIYVGDYSFAGSNVSVLAGSHDMHLIGLLRRDVEITEGCDIHIGSGVWLGSGSTILGPCTIGDNAVIAAGAVVTPRTIIPPCSVYGGVPAKMLAKLNLEDEEIKNRAIIKALERNGGILFGNGWSDKRPGFESPGHWLLGDCACLIVVKKEYQLNYCLEDADQVELLIANGENNIRITLAGPEGSRKIVLPAEDGKITELIVRKMTTQGRLFVSMTEGIEEEDHTHE